MFIRTLVTLTLSAQVFFCATAQEKDYHSFTDKKGQSIEAALVSISEDKKKATIQRKDGRDFEIAILALSLDDQQFIKNWLKTSPVKLDFHLEVTVTKHQQDTNRKPVPNYDLKWVTHQLELEITILNRSRANLNGASAEYYIITEQGVRSQPYDAATSKQYGVDEWWYSNKPLTLPKRKQKKSKMPLLLSHGKTKLEDLAINHASKLQSDTLHLREIEGAREARAKDSILGVIVRITDADGKEISVHRSSDHKLLKRSWDKIAAMPPGDPLGNPPAPGPAGPAS